MRFSKPVKRKRPDGTPMPYYWCRVTHPDGRRTWLSTSCKSKPAAEAWIKAEELRVAQGPDAAARATAAAMTFSEAWATWIESKRGAVGASHFKKLVGHGQRSFIPFFGNMRLHDIEPDTVSLYLTRRRAGLLPKDDPSPAAAATVNTERTSLGSFFLYCRRRRWLADSPVIATTRASGSVKRKTFYLTHAEERALLTACGAERKVVVTATRNAGGPKGGATTPKPSTWTQTQKPSPALGMAVLLGIRCGFRLGTVVRLCWGHADLKNGRWCIPADLMKSRAEYKHAMPESVKLALTEWRAALASEDADVTARLAPDATILGLAYRNSLLRGLRSACKSAGLPALRFHDLRRIYMARLREAGVPIEVAMSLTDHRSLAVVMASYREVRADEVEAAVAALDEKHERGGGERPRRMEG